MAKNFLLDFAVAVVFFSFTVKGAPASAGKFQIADNGVHGEGSYQRKGDSVEIALRLVIGTVSASEVNRTADKVGYTKPAVDSNHPASFSFNDEESKFMREVLQEHNVYRGIHGSSPLKLSTAMSMEAFAFAQDLAKNGTLKHSPVSSRPDQGESLAMGCATDGPGITAEGVVKKWYDEVCKHNFANQDFQKPSGHFINLVWKPSEQLGIAKAHGMKWGMNCTWVVARYRPRVEYRPEVENSFGLNVEKGSFDPAYCNSVTEVQGQELAEKNGARIGESGSQGSNKPEFYKDGRPRGGNMANRMRIPRIARVLVA